MEESIEVVDLGDHAEGIVAGGAIVGILYWSPPAPKQYEDGEPAVFDAGFFGLTVDRPHGRQPLLTAAEPDPEAWEQARQAMLRWLEGRWGVR
jgi:hypothetical protein